MGGSSGGGTQTTQVKLPGWLNEQLKSAGAQIGQTGAGLESKLFPGPFVAQRTPYDEQALGLGQQYISDVGKLGPQAAQYATDVAQGKYLDFAKNPAYQNFIKSSIYDPLQANLQNVILPGVRSTGIDQGAFGGSRNAVADVFATRQAQQVAADAAAKAGLGAYGMERGFQQAAPSMMMQAGQLLGQPGQAASQLGELERKLQELGISEQKQQFGEQYAGPFRGETAWLNALSPLLNTYGGGTTVTTQPNQGSTTSNVLGGGLGGGLSGLALGAALAPATGGLSGMVLPALLGGGGGLLGALGGLFG